jgi:cation:H+ antiporter
MADKEISNFDGVFMVMLYVLLLFFIEKKQGLMEVVNKKIHKQRVNHLALLLKIFGGVILVYFSSEFIVNQTIYFSHQLKVSPFYISLLGLSLGTNLPEISLAVRSVLTGKKDIAFGDYVGSAAANTLLFGILSLFYQGPVNINGNFYISFIFIILGLTAFYWFSRSKNTISRSEGGMLLALYAVFIFIELSKTRLGY